MVEAVSVIRANNVSKQVDTYDGPLTILAGVDLDIKPGETLAILGASGSGKSTLLSLLAGLDVPTGGSIHLCGQEISTLGEDGRAEVRGEHISFVFQSFQLLPSLTALENVMLPLEVLGKGDARAAAEQWLERVGLQGRLGHYPNQLSGGEQQRVAIARAFVSNPHVLFADEPTGNLDTATGHKIIDLLFELNREQHTTLVLVTHDQTLADRCDRRVHISSGQLTEEVEASVAPAVMDGTA